MAYDLATEYRLASTGDAWSDCLFFHFAIADTLYWHHGVEVPEEWRYSPGMGDGRDDHDKWLEEVPTEELIAFGDKLHRLAGILRARGLDY